MPHDYQCGEGSAKPRATRITIFDLHLNLTAPSNAAIVVTGRDSASAWVNGQQVLESESVAAWKQMPWEDYKKRDITQQ